MRGYWEKGQIREALSTLIRPRRRWYKDERDMRPVDRFARDRRRCWSNVRVWPLSCTEASPTSLVRTVFQEWV